MTNRLVRTLLALTFVTGIVDAICFLGLGQVFAAMQTGNVLFLGFGLGGAAGVSLVAPLVGLGAFLGGGALAAWLAARVSSPRRLATLSAAMSIEVALLLGAALIAAVLDVTPDRIGAYVLIAALSLAMGLRGTSAQRIGETNIATTVLNLTMASIAAPSGLVAGHDLAERGTALLAILAGALVGALLLRGSVALAIATAALLTLAVRVAATGAARSSS